MLLSSKCQQSYWLLDVDCGCILVLCTYLLRVVNSAMFVHYIFPTIADSGEVLGKLEKEKGSYCRFPI